jgi:hypothetical protein
MSLPDLDDEDGRAAYRKELRRVALPARLGGVGLIVLGGILALMARTSFLGIDNRVMPAAYACLGIGWMMYLAAVFIRTRHHKRRLAEGL